MSKKLKAVESNIQSNHKEAELWVTPTNNDGSKEVKYWNSKAQSWSKCEGEGNGGDVEAAAEYYRIDWDKAKELGYDENDTNLLSFSGEFNSLIKATRYVKQSFGNNEIIYIGPTGMCDLIFGITNTTHVLFTPIESVSKSGNEINSTKINSLKESNSNYPGQLDCFIPCTKEEFYTLE